MPAKDIDLTARTLCFIHDTRRILLGQKKRGFGAGYWNGFGGHVEKGETVEQAAHRELWEEAGLKADALHKRGELFFTFDHDRSLDLRIHVFKGIGVRGEPRETDEMLPRWFSLDAIPYPHMWADDPHWLPLFLAGKTFEGKFRFKDLKELADVQITEIA